jgi:hypothetical protein
MKLYSCKLRSEIYTGLSQRMARTILQKIRVIRPFVEFAFQVHHKNRYLSGNIENALEIYILVFQKTAFYL